MHTNGNNTMDFSSWEDLSLGKNLIFLIFFHNLSGYFNLSKAYHIPEGLNILYKFSFGYFGGS